MTKTKESHLIVIQTCGNKFPCFSRSLRLTYMIIIYDQEMFWNDCILYANIEIFIALRPWQTFETCVEKEFVYENENYEITSRLL